MENESTNEQLPILEVAWTRFSQLDAKSEVLDDTFHRLRRAVAILGVVATLLAIISDAYSDWLVENNLALVALILKFFLVLTPIVGSVIAAYSNKFHSGANWLAMRAGAEEILKEIYMFRTIMQKTPDRRRWLESRLATIQRQVYKSQGGELILKPYAGQIPPYYNPDSPDSDPGFRDLNGEEYFRYRLQDQLAWHIKRVNEFQKERTRRQLVILAAGGAGALLAGIGGSLTIFVALTASIAAAYVGWDELRNLDTKVKNYSKVIMELMILYDHWTNLSEAERSEAEFYQLVQSTEDILWSQNVEYIKAMQEALPGAEDDDSILVNEVVRMSLEESERMKREMRESLMEEGQETLKEVSERVVETFDEGVGTLAEDFESEEVQKELDYLGDRVQAAVAQASTFAGKLEVIAYEFAGIDVTKETDKETLNAILSAYPPSGEIKG